MKRLTHIDKKGSARMVDVTKKKSTLREAIAGGSVKMNLETLRLIEDNQIAKGDVLGVARVAGIMGAKKTSSLIPMCHPLNITSISVDFLIDSKNSRIDIEAIVRIHGQTGVEMEALTSVSIAALTIYDMCKSVDKSIVISDIKLIKKSGGKSGKWKRE